MEPPIPSAGIAFAARSAALLDALMATDRMVEGIRRQFATR
jgi:hypothetical protein